MNNSRRMIAYIVYIVIGAALFVLGLLELADSFWSGMGGGLAAVGAVRMIQIIRCRSDETYREKQEIELQDERNRFIRNKAWAWAGYLFVIIAAVCTVVFRLLGQELLSVAAGSAVCIFAVLYWVSFLILRKKY